MGRFRIVMVVEIELATMKVEFMCLYIVAWMKGNSCEIKTTSGVNYDFLLLIDER